MHGPDQETGALVEQTNGSANCCASADPDGPDSGVVPVSPASAANPKRTTDVLQKTDDLKAFAPKFIQLDN
jgi:hypothetical protein